MFVMLLVVIYVVIALVQNASVNVVPRSEIDRSGVEKQADKLEHGKTQLQPQQR